MSYDELINKSFYFCVDLLKSAGNSIGMTYEAINIWLFCIIGPIVFIVMLVMIVSLRRKVRRMRVEVVGDNLPRDKSF